MKLKSIYLLQEPACLNPHSGAFQHISVGLVELSKYYDISAYLNTHKIDLDSLKKNVELKDNKNNLKIPYKFSITKLYGTLKDLHEIVKALINIPRLFRIYKREKIAFVYERTAFINFSGLIAAKLVGINHFYEANGIQFKTREKYYRSWLTPLIKEIEKWMYKNSNHTFFVGTYGFYWQLKTENWSNIENGIEINNLNNYQPKILQNQVDICFIGRLMSHHKFDILIEALNLISTRIVVNFHILGSGFESIYKKLSLNKINVFKYGFLSRKEINKVVINFHIGVIAGSPEYTSNMKLFDYASGNCAVIAPSIINFKFWFQEELCFFDGSAKDLAEKIQFLINDVNFINHYGQKLHYKVRQQFTWDKIYGEVATTMNKVLEQQAK